MARAEPVAILYCGCGHDTPCPQGRKGMTERCTIVLPASDVPAALRRLQLFLQGERPPRPLLAPLRKKKSPPRT